MGWLSGWSKRQPITLTGGSDGAQTDFQLKLAIAYDSDMLSDFSDLRFTQEDGETLIDSWLEDKTDGTSADVVVEFPSTPASGDTQTYYMYYGKSDALDYWDGDATFIDFSDFDDLTGWTQQAGTWAVSSGVLNAPGGGSGDTYLRRDTSITETSYIIETAMKAVDDYYHGIIMAEADNPMARTASIAATTQTEGTYPNTVLGWTDWPADTPAATADFTVLYDYQITGLLVNPVDNNKAIARNIGSSAYTQTGIFNDGSGTGNFWGFLGKEYCPTYDVDWVFVRKYAANPPTYEFGSEETESGGLSMAIVMHHLMQMRRS